MLLDGSGGSRLETQGPALPSRTITALGQGQNRKRPAIARVMTCSHDSSEGEKLENETDSLAGLAWMISTCAGR
jgi:hypothetical protein